MKFDFWLDLPKALANILKEDMSKDDEEMLKSLRSTEVNYNLTPKELSNGFSQISHLIDTNAHNLTNTELDILRQKLFFLQKEKTEILCKTIKFSTRLMTKILASIEQISAPHKEVLIKIKMFLKITRMVVEQSKSSLEGAKSENENKFFSM
jgi:hypothetical protein